MNKITIGSDEYSGMQIKSGSSRLASRHAMVGEELTTDELYVTLDGNTVPLPADITTRYTVNTAIIVELSGNIAGRFYFQSITYCGPAQYKVYAVSAVGVLMKSRHMGGIYNGITASVLLADILNGFSYDIAPEIADATISGYLPIATRRDNLKQVLLVIGATITINNYGKVTISAMSSTSAGDFTASRSYVGGGIKTDTVVDGVKLTEHNYFPSGEDKTLFEDGINGTETIEFREPYHSLSCVGATIIESGANYCKLSGTGTVTLTGKPYTHVTRVVTAGDVTPSATANIKSITTAYLANPQVAQTVVDRIYAMMQCNISIEKSVIVGAERAGDVCRVTNPYTGVLTPACIQEMDISMSGINKANAKFLVGFIPHGVISGYQHYALLTGNGSWTVPAGVTKIRAIIVGAGSGGGGGGKGKDGEETQVSEIKTTSAGRSNDATRIKGSGGSGGSGGRAGSGGKIFEISLDVLPGSSISYSCGTAGSGGTGETAAIEKTDGTAGTSTTFGGYSSDYGRLYPYGYQEPKTGLTIGKNGAEGITGGKGGDGSDGVGRYHNESHEYVLYCGQNGESVKGKHGGYGAKGQATGDNPYNDYGGGGGGGASADADCENYASASKTGISGGDGANALSALSAAQNSYGSGGDGGNGGGGGGGAACRLRRFNWGGDSDWIYYSASGGLGGNGGNGGNGANGCIIIYY